MRNANYYIIKQKSKRNGFIWENHLLCVVSIAIIGGCGAVEKAAVPSYVSSYVEQVWLFCAGQAVCSGNWF